MVPEAGLEPARLAAEDFKSPASAISPLRPERILQDVRPGSGRLAFPGWTTFKGECRRDASGVPRTFGFNGRTL